MVLEESYGFEQVAIKQKKNICTSRLNVDITTEAIKGVKLDTPLISANMSSVTDANFALLMQKYGGLGILHRAWVNIEDYLNEVRLVADNSPWVAASIGIGTKEYELAQTLIRHGANILVIDIAHGYCDAVIDLGRKIKQFSPQTKIVLGNTVNIGLLEETSDYVDAIKVGIGGGLACTTAFTAGCTERQFSAVLKFKLKAKELGVPIISDGGIRIPADFSKAILAGANSVMAGSIFARCPESAAQIEYINGTPKKTYFGMSSERSQEEWKGGLKPNTCAEGKVVHLDIGEPLSSIMQTYSGALRSAITYAGGKDIYSAQKEVEFIRLM